MRPLVAAILWTLAVVGVGCAQKEPPAEVVVSHFAAAPQDFATVHRVVFLEMDAPANCHDERLSQDVTAALFTEIQRRQLFRVDTAQRSDPRCDGLTLRGQKATFKELSNVRRQFDCDAVLLGSVVQFEPYPRMKITLSLTLLDTRTGRLLWGVDHTWDTADKCLERRAEQFFKTQMRPGFEPADSKLVQMSPRFFEQLVATEAASTLPAPGQALAEECVAAARGSGIAEKPVTSQKNTSSPSNSPR